MRLLLAAAFVLLSTAVLAQSIFFYSAQIETRVPSSNVGALPPCNAPSQGTIRLITDALLPVALTTAAGGGGVRVLVYCNGTQWIVT